MSRISKAVLNEKELNQLRDHFSYMISSLQNNLEIENFFNQFLTKEEKIMLAKRLVLYMMLKRNYSPTVIQQALKISYETVRLHNNYFKSKDQKFLEVIDKLLKREKTQEFLKGMEKLAKPFELLAKAQHDMKARAKFATGDWFEDNH